MRNERLRIGSLVIAFPYLFWVTGIILPFLYFTFFLNIKKIVRRIVEKDTYVTLAVVFIGLQFVSVLFSITTDFFTLERFFGIIHNILSFSFVVLGYSFCFYPSIKNIIAKYADSVFVISAIASILIFIYSYKTGVNLSYPSIPGLLLGIKSDLGTVSYSQMGYFLNNEIPRSRFLGTFPNTTAILLLLLFAVMAQTSQHLRYLPRLFRCLILFAAVLTTGSRSAVLLSFIFAFVYMSKRRYVFLFLILLSPIYLGLIYVVVEFFVKSRVDSNLSRLGLYWESLRLMWETNPLFGLGIKPKVDFIAEGEFPVGSHSTFIGYFVKNGLIGGGMALFFFLSLIGKSLFRLTSQLLSSSQFSIQTVRLDTFIIGMLIVFMFEDFDSYELIPFYFGILLFCTRYPHEFFFTPKDELSRRAQ